MLKGLLNHKALARIFSLLLAFVLWLHISTRNVTEEAIFVPLELVNFPPSMVVADNLPEGVSLRVRGPAALTRFVNERKPRFRIDLSEAHRGLNSFALSAGSLGLPRGLTVSRMVPSTVDVTLEPVETKVVPLKPSLIGEPAPGFLLEEVVVEPGNITLRGPANLLARIDYIETNPININEARQSLAQKVAPVFPEHGLSVMDGHNIVAQVKIAEITGTAAVSHVPVRAEAGFKAVGEVTVTISGPASLVKGITAADLTAKALWPPEKPPVGRLRAEVTITGLPQNVEVVKITPAQVHLEAPQVAPETGTPSPAPGAEAPAAEDEQPPAGP